MIQDLMSSKLISFLSEIESLGFRLCLVGGIPRDFFLNKTLGVDFDFEIRAASEISSEQWPSYYKKLIHFFDSKKIKYTELSYLITRIDFHGTFLEFASPRTEENLEDKVGHHHFKALLDSNLSYFESFKRRDFTINAIGIELDLKARDELLIDPYHGLLDLQAETIRAVSEDFFHDSVRFLRLIRFSLKFQKMKVDEPLLNDLSKFNLQGLSVFHFTQELFKSQGGDFLNLFVQLVKSHGLLLPDKFKFWTKYSFPSHLKSKEEILAFVFLQNESDAISVLSFFSMPEKKLRDLKSLMGSFNRLSKVTLDDHKMVLAQSVDKALGNEIFKDYKNINDKKEWYETCSVLVGTDQLVLTLEDISKEVVDKSTGVLNLPPELRSYWPFYLAVKKKLGL